jgi:hypothetical protein
MLFIFIVFGILAVIIFLRIIAFVRGGSVNSDQKVGSTEVFHANKFAQDMQKKSLQDAQDAAKRAREDGERAMKQMQSAMKANQENLTRATNQAMDISRKNETRARNDFNKQQMRNKPFGGFGKNKF